MMKRSELFFRLIALLFVLSISLVHAQVSDPNTGSEDKKAGIVLKNDGTEFVGYILSDDTREVLIETSELGKVIIPKHEIKSIKYIDANDKLMINSVGRNRFASRYFLTTNGLPIEKGEDYAMFSIYGPEIHFAVSDNLSLGVMTTWMFAPLVGSAKYSVPLGKNINLGVGVLAGGIFYSFAPGVGALGYGSLTIGDRTSNFTVSAGYAGVTEVGYGEYNSSGSAPLMSVAFMAKVGKNMSFVGDSFIYMAEGDKFALIMPGLRFSDNPKRAFQIGVGMIVVDNEVIPSPIPVVSWFRALN
ncbi:MAG: hypothetical protein R3C61_25985 [Bacteroidia bacterium]